VFAPLALKVPPLTILRPLLKPTSPAPWIVLSTLVNVSVPLLVIPKNVLSGLSESTTVPPPVSVVPSETRK